MNTSNANLITIRHTTSQDENAIEALAASAFGPGRFSRAAFRLREGVSSESDLSFVAELDGVVIGSVTQTKVSIGDLEALMLGPLVVEPDHRKYGIGRELMNRTLFAARSLGHRYTILVGDLAYYGAFGFSRIAQGKITLPGPADPLRILGCDLTPGAADAFSGTVRKRGS